MTPEHDDLFDLITEHDEREPERPAHDDLFDIVREHDEQEMDE